MENITKINKYREDINTTNTDRNRGTNLQCNEQKEQLALTSTALACMSCPVALRYIQNAFEMLCNFLYNFGSLMTLLSIVGH